MKKSKIFKTIISKMHNSFTRLPDYRRGINTQYEIKDAAVAVFSVFFTQSPSFLASQQLLQKRKGKTIYFKGGRSKSTSFSTRIYYAARRA